MALDQGPGQQEIIRAVAPFKIDEMVDPAEEQEQGASADQEEPAADQDPGRGMRFAHRLPWRKLRAINCSITTPFFFAPSKKR